MFHRPSPLRGAALTLSTAVLVGCGRGLYLGWEGGGYDDLPPSVSLVSSVTTARIGDPVRLGTDTVLPGRSPTVRG